MRTSWVERAEPPLRARAPDLGAQELGPPAAARPPAVPAARASWLTPRRVMLIFALTVALIAVAIAARLTQTLAAKKTVADRVTPAVTVTEAGRSAAPTTVSITGTIDARYDTPIGAEGDAGRVAAVYVEAGDHVKRGQILARIDTSVLVPQVANLQASLDLARAESELAAAEYRRAVAVGKSGALSTEETERRRSSSVTADAKVKVAAAQLAEAQARLARAEIRAPADGVILTRTVEAGQTVSSAGSPLFRMAEGDEVELRGDVAETDLPLLKVGQAVNVRLTGSAQLYPGRVRLLGAVIDPQTRLGMIRVSLAPDPNLRPGAFARAEVTVSNAQRIVLPQTAVLTDEKGSYVLVVNADDKIERRPVHVSGMVENGVTIADGVSASDRVVATAGAFLQVGETVKPVTTAAVAAAPSAS